MVEKLNRSFDEDETPAHLKIPFSEMDPLDLRVFQDGKEIKLMTYRYKVPASLERKGILFYIHGFGTYCEQKAFVFKKIAEHGYETFAFDQRGFGHSEGLQGYFGSSATLLNDIELFLRKTMDLYNIDPKVTPMFLFGQSLGGLLSFCTSIRFNEWFKGMVLVVPLFKVKDKKFYKFHWVLKTINFISPKMTFSGKNKFYNKEYREKFSYIFNDPKKVTKARVQSLVMFKELEDYARQFYTQSKAPYLLVTAKHDIQVDNQAALEMQQMHGNPMSKHLEMEDSDHLSVLVIEEEGLRIANETVIFLDSILAKQQKQK